LVSRRTDERGWLTEGRVVGCDDDLGEQGCQSLAGQIAAELLLEQVADHSITLRLQEVERIGGDLIAGVVLEPEEPDLWSVAVGQHHSVLGCHFGDRLGRPRRVGPSHRSFQRLAAAPQGVAAEGDHDQHQATSRADEAPSSGSGPDQ
jgi:hypothetical protein